MKKVLLSLVVIIAAVGFGSNAAAQGKIGYISADELMAAMPETDSVSKILQDYQSSLQEQGADYYKEYLEKDSIFQADSAKWTPTQKELKRTALGELVQKVQGWQQTMQQMLQEKSQSLVGPLRTKATDAIKATAKENGYTYVLESAAVLVGPPGDDILPLVKKKMGIGAPKPAAGGVKKP